MLHTLFYILNYAKLYCLVFHFEILKIEKTFFYSFFWGEWDFPYKFYIAIYLKLCSIC